MATIRLVPSTYYLSNTTYLSVSNYSNMYTDTDSTTYGTVANSQTGTTSYYIYLRGFNFGSIPEGSKVNSYTVKIKASQSGGNTNTNYTPKLCNGTSQITSTCSAITTSVQTLTFTGVSTDWSTIAGYGSNFGIRINCRRANRNTAASFNIYGAEILVDFDPPATVTTTLVGEGSIHPSGSKYYSEGAEYDLTITPNDPSAQVSATKNGSSITLTKHTGGSFSETNVLGEYNLVSGSFNGSGASYFQGLVGKGHTNTQTTSNYYSGGSGTIAVFTYDVSFDDVPDNANITNLYMIVNGHAESTSNSNEYMCVRLISGSTELSSELNFKSVGTSNTNQTVTATTLPTASQLADLKIQCRLGYYGGAINGATVYIEYEVSGVWYTYSTTIDGDTTIVVTIGSSGGGPVLHIKDSGQWKQVTKVYVKVNGSWVEQSDITNVFSEGVNYRKAN